MDRFLKIAFTATVIVAIGMVIYANYKKHLYTPDEENLPSAMAKHLPLLLDLGAEYCPPCQMMKPVLAGLKKEFAGRLIVISIDLENHPEANEKYAIEFLPTLIFYDASGKILYRHEGFMFREGILAKWKELGISFKK
jgi:thioredoxin 1